MFGDTALLRMVVEQLAQTHKWSYEEAMHKFYKSEVCKALSDRRTGMFTFAPREIVAIFNEKMIAG